MIKNAVIIPFLFALVCFPKWSNADVQPDSSIAPIATFVSDSLKTTNSNREFWDSLPAGYPNDKFASTALKGNPFLYDRMMSPFQFDSLPISTAGDFRFGMNAYRQYLNIPSPILPLDTHLALSQLRIVLGSKREQLILLDHHQRISKRMTGYVSYNNIVSPGFLLNSISRYRRLNLNLNFNAKKMSSSLALGFLKIKVDENGGVKPNQKVDGLSKSDYERLITFLPDDNREIRRSFVELKNEVLLFKSGSEVDSTTIFKLNLYGNGTYFKFGSLYNGTSDSLYYTNEFLNSTVTRDTAGYHYYSFHPGISFSWDNVKLHGQLKAGWSKYLLSTRIDSLEATREFSSVNLFAALSSHNWNLDMKWDRVMSSFVTDGDVSLLVNTFLHFNDVLSSVTITGGLAELAPEATTLSFVSNHFIWKNNFNKEKFTWVKPSIGFLKDRLIFYSQMTQIENYVYFNDEAQPQQRNETVKIFFAGVKADIQIRHWRLMGDVRSMNSSKGYVRLPDWGAYARFSYRDRFFKKALLTEFGVSIATAAQWKSYAFMPATGALYLQSDQTVGGSPSMDVFLNADIGRATLTLMLQRINSKWFGGENYVAPGYPAPPNTLKFGVLWKLYN
ncbi:MAG: putative porin [Bacteroidia bacterium]